MIIRILQEVETFRIPEGIFDDQCDRSTGNKDEMLSGVLVCKATA
jgi:hypothetical protein